MRPGPALGLLGRWLVASSFLVVPGASLANNASVTCHGEPRVCASLVTAERDLAAMLVSGDTGAIRRHFADDAVWSLANGRRWTRSEAITAVASAPRMASSRLIEADVRQFGRIAIVLWREGWHKRLSSPEEQSFGTDTWMLKDGRWRIIASQEARLPDRP